MHSLLSIYFWGRLVVRLGKRLALAAIPKLNCSNHRDNKYKAISKLLDQKLTPFTFVRHATTVQGFSTIKALKTPFVPCLSASVYLLIEINCFVAFATLWSSAKRHLRWNNFMCEVGKGNSHIRSVRCVVSAREDTCPEPSAFWGTVASSFPRRLYLPSVSTGSPFAAGWTVSERPTIGSRWVPSRGLRHSRQAL